MERIKVVLSAAVTYLTTAAVVLGIFSEEIGKVFQLPDAVGQVIVGVLAAIGVAISIIRRVEPVIPSRRGILEPPLPEAARLRLDRGESTLVTIVVVLAIVFLVAVLMGWIAL